VLVLVLDRVLDRVFAQNTHSAGVLVVLAVNVLTPLAVATRCAHKRKLV
jgi:hypothetical protein